jgi:hypothetical protein
LRSWELISWENYAPSRYGLRGENPPRRERLQGEKGSKERKAPWRGLPRREVPKSGPITLRRVGCLGAPKFPVRKATL